MSCKSVSFKLGFCARKRTWYQWEELATTVIPCYDKDCIVKNGEGESQKQPGTTELCVVIHLGEKLRYCSQLTGRNNLLASENFTTKRKEGLFFFSFFLLAFVIIYVAFSVSLLEIDAFLSSRQQLIPLPLFPWENVNSWIVGDVLFSMGNLSHQQHSSPCQKYSSMDPSFCWVIALLLKIQKEVSIFGWKCKVLFNG